MRRDNLENPSQLLNQITDIIADLENGLDSLKAQIRPLSLLSTTLPEIISELESKVDPYSQDGTSFCNKLNDREEEDENLQGT
jgi:hypothetical protein